LGGSSHKRFIATALWRIATPGDAGAIHPIRNSVIDALKFAAVATNVCFSRCGAADGFGQLHCCICEH